MIYGGGASRPLSVLGGVSLGGLGVLLVLWGSVGLVGWIDEGLHARMVSVRLLAAWQIGIFGAMDILGLALAYASGRILIRQFRPGRRGP